MGYNWNVARKNDPDPRSAIACRIGKLMMYIEPHVVTARRLQCVSIGFALEAMAAGSVQ